MREYAAAKAGPIEPRLATIEGAAESLAVSERTVRRLIHDGQLRSVKVGGRRLIPVAALDEFVAALAEGAA